MAPSGMLYVRRGAEKPLLDTTLPSLSEKRTEPAQFLLFGILDICSTPWRNSGTCWVFVAINLIFTITSKENLIT